LEIPFWSVDIRAQNRNQTAERKIQKKREFDLQDRFIDYAVRIIALSEALPDTKAGKHVASQILRSGTSPAPN